MWLCILLVSGRRFDMRRHLFLGFLAVTSALLPQICNPAGLPPWQFGMSKDEVVGFSDFGPYKSFRNGDVETYNGLFDGRKGNVQFFFNDSGLRRIGVYEYEGKDGTLANAAWMRSYGASSPSTAK
jgi:hypothetical protein